MEEVLAKLSQLSMVSKETGVLLDLDQLKHKSTRQHVECPARLQSIYAHLQLEGLLSSPKVELVNQLRKADRASIEAVHDSDYVDFIEQMWPEEETATVTTAAATTKKEIYIVDTYINQHSSHAAYLGAGATLEAIDRVLANEWKNAFCVIRPPGHHAGHSRVCTGFCYFNNVAVGTKYLQNQHGIKKVLILDWDIHHGDGTQHIFNDDPNVLIVSLHRFDQGRFYPKSGSVENKGKGGGTGLKVNIPWDIGYEGKAQKAGTDEYIYAFERIIAPIFQSFQPEFVMISAGFDSAEGDPLGQCQITYEGYAYMTRRVMDMMKGKNVVVCLEGGYNLESIAWASEAVLRTLTGEDFPLPKNKRQLGLEGLKNAILPNSVGFAAVRKCLTAYSPHWPCLEKFGNAYDKLVLENIRSRCLISAGHEKNFVIRGDTILKKCKENEMQFYRDLLDPLSPDAEQNAHLQQFIPKFLGFEMLKGSEYVKLENLTYGHENGSIIDFKLGKNTLHSSYSADKTATVRKKDLKTTSDSHGYRVSGVIVKNDIGVPTDFVQSGDFLSSFQQKDVIEFTKKVFSNNEKAINQFLDFLVSLLDFFTQKNTRSFVSTSIIVIVDLTVNSHQFKLIDFNYVDTLPGHNQRDTNVILGIQSILQFMQEIQADQKISTQGEGSADTTPAL